MFNVLNLEKGGVVKITPNRCERYVYDRFIEKILLS